ncbi:hypothetical protein MLD38_004692 [Melastoma candidum]|uniref:Uncharacterized protein n=1 Tax=Melastoma candidum TaxID=119954 RepID=A0ACB9S604_9MYRT|nr:hypothetical protein MLD38_004692 [Melastoma candidum]
MATGQNRTEQPGKAVKEAPGKSAPPPPPPEKPSPDDCCGSGCVRCVWDVYYEDLEEYEKLYGNGGGSDGVDSSSSKASS